MLKAAIKHASDVDKVRNRTLPPEQVTRWATKLEDLIDEVAAFLKEEKEEKAICQAEMELKKGGNIVREGFAGHLERRRTYARRTRTRPG